MATPRRGPPTHLTVWVGLVLAIVGLVIAMYAYTGSRIYDIRYAYIAVGGGVLALSGIMVSAWGRAVMSTRAAQLNRRAPIRAISDEPPTPTLDSPPTVAVVENKRRFTFPAMPSLPKRGAKATRPKQGKANDRAAVFSFRRPQRAPASPSDAHQVAALEPVREAPDAPEDEARPRAIDLPLDDAPAVVAVEVETAPAEPEPAPYVPSLAMERVTMRCPRCATEFTAEGIRPMPILCPGCGLTGRI